MARRDRRSGSRGRPLRVLSIVRAPGPARMQVRQSLADPQPASGRGRVAHWQAIARGCRFGCARRGRRPSPIAARALVATVSSNPVAGPVGERQEPCHEQQVRNDQEEIDHVGGTLPRSCRPCSGCAIRYAPRKARRRHVCNIHVQCSKRYSIKPPRSIRQHSQRNLRLAPLLELSGGRLPRRSEETELDRPARSTS